MSNDVEKRVLEKTRRNHSEIPSLIGNLVKVETQDGKFVDGERDIKNPMLGILAIAGGVATIIITLEKVFLN